MDKKLKEYLLSEEAHAFKGWDFSYLKGRWEGENLPWDYSQIVKKYLKEDDLLLDMGTGGGELLSTFNHKENLTSVTEAYEPNIKLCLETLSPKGITVYPIKQDDILLNVPSNFYDIVINHHESFNPREVNRVLKSGGLFITQQVGAYNNKALATFFDKNHVDQFPDMTMEKSVDKLKNSGFEVLFSQEHYPKTKFFDLGAVVFFAKIISWEFLGFSVEKSVDKLDELNEVLKRDGYIESTEHRYMIVAQKK